MYDSTRTLAVLVTVVAVVGLAVAPVAAAQTDDGTTDADESGDSDDGESNESDDSALAGDAPVVSERADHGPFPDEICTDLLAMVDEEAPYDQVIWVSDLPEDAQPPGVPWDVITPEAIGGIVVGATPNQCEVQDPNDPTYDPREDNVDPDGNADVQEDGEGKVLVIVNGTLNKSGEGPGVTGEADLDIGENGSLDPDASLNDGEKDYRVDPGLQYWNDGTTYFETDVYVFEKSFGAEKDCFGEECNIGTRGLPEFADYPSVPAPSDRERPDDGNDEEESDDEDGADADDDGDGADSGGGGGSPGADSDSDSDDDSGSNDADDGGGSADDGDDGGEEETETETETETEEETDTPTETETETETEEETEEETDAPTETETEQQAEQALAAQSSGLGVVIALVVLLLGAAALAPRE